MEFKFELNELEAQQILDYLSKEPYIEVACLIEKIQTQAYEQRQEQSEKER